jgi:hypothetical protein
VGSTARQLGNVGGGGYSSFLLSQTDAIPALSAQRIVEVEDLLCSFGCASEWEGSPLFVSLVLHPEG